MSATAESPASGGPDEQLRRKHAALIAAMAICQNDRKCPEGSICRPIDDETIGCFSSSCRSARSTECGPEKTCALVDAEQRVYRCVPAGTVDVGGECYATRLAASDKRCASGLECIGGICRRQCDEHDECNVGSCVHLFASEAAYCIEGLCTKDDDCGPGNLCTDAVVAGDVKTGIKTCLARGKLADGTLSCMPLSCPSGEACDMHRQGAQLLARCRLPCNELDADACPTGTTCSSPSKDSPAYCFAACDPGDPGTCSDQESCSAAAPNFDRWACVPRRRYDPALLSGPDPIYTDPAKTIPATELAPSTNG